MIGAGGLAAIAAKERQQESTKAEGQKLREQQLKAAQEHLETFRTKLTSFAKKYKKQLNTDPEFRKTFNDMCMEIGVDPLQSQGGFWSDLTGLGDFYHELSIKIIDVCINLKSNNGGFIELEQILEKVRKTYGSNPPKLDKNDIKKAISKLDSLGNGYQVIKIGGKDYLKIVSFEMDSDANKLMDTAGDKGYFEQSDIMSLRWDPEKIQNALNSLLDQGIVWVDLKSEPNRYYVAAAFPGFN